MTKIAQFDPNNLKTWNSGLIAFASVVGFFGVILFLVTLVWFFTWIKYSFFRTTNSANFTGGQLAQAYLSKYGVNAKRIKFRGTNNINVESKFLYLRPYLDHGSSFTLRLVPWTYHRTSIYTLAMTMESTWAVSSEKSSRFNSFWWEFSRRITLIVVLIPFILAAFFAFGLTKGWSGFTTANSNTAAIVFSILGAIFLLGYSLSQIMFYAKSRKEITKNLQGFLQANEIKAISWIFQIKFIYYIIRFIYETLRFILQILILLQQRNKSN